MRDIERRFINPQQGALDTVLPDAVGYSVAGRDVYVANIDTTNTVTVRTAAGQTVNGVLTLVVPAGQSVFLMSDGANWFSAPSRWAVQGCRVFNSANQVIATATVTTLTFDSERFDTDGMHSTAVNTSRITIAAPGKYLIGACINWDVSALGQRFHRFMLNGATEILRLRNPPVAGGVLGSTYVLETVYDLAAGDFVEVQVQQDTGGNLNVAASPNFSPEFWAHRLS